MKTTRELSWALQRRGWSGRKNWPQETINPPCSECGNPIAHRQGYRLNQHEQYEIPRALFDPTESGTVESPKRAHEKCLLPLVVNEVNA